MSQSVFYWKGKEIREQIDIVSNKSAPNLVLENATYLNSFLKSWETANIWIHKGRIIYVGPDMPPPAESTEVTDCRGRYLVPGYIEPHAHPFQLYNPQSLAEYVSQYGTTTLINDNLFLLLYCDKKKALTLLDAFQSSPLHMFWWARLDLQTEIPREDLLLTLDYMKAWIQHDSVIQAGELTGWPKLLDGDDLLLQWICETKQQRKRIEGHFPGASPRTLTKMKLFGADCDHEAMTGEEVRERLAQGYHVSLRHSSIRPDLPKLLDEMKNCGIHHYEQIMFTTDGSTPLFYEDGMTNKMISIALEKGIDPITAYHMASFHIARYYGIDHMLGAIAPGRSANINILESPEIPLPLSVLSKGQWMKKAGKKQESTSAIRWSDHSLGKMELNWELRGDDLQFSMPLGLKMRNSVIMEPYSVTIDSSLEELSEEHDESFLSLLDRKGEWRVNTVLKGFASSISGFASSYSTTGDILLIGKKKSDMLLAFQRMKELGGGIVLVEDGATIFELALVINGGASDENLPALISKTKELGTLLRERGYRFEDPVYTLLFLSSTHLPYLRITPRGIYDVMKKTILFPSIMR
ncbi:amidohydrolase family protein [Bacillus lacus]|uniref:adenine deaminase n=1 Tax=Metabacillus lacus TaxID=1983721 RepID=A0A7X2IZH9_9BACI|nr:adenine deaminase C-terminal domain-containing protein [Metabacillus lacus]MRX72663.1 amidohydrolase family protein [Metabacillus lacus]